MSKKKIKTIQKHFCTGCQSEAGLLLITLPFNMFRRPGGKRHRLCPQCIKPLQDKFGLDEKGRTVPVNMWGQGKQSNVFAKFRDRLSKET